MRSVWLERLIGASGAEVGHIWLIWVWGLNSDSWFTWFSHAGEGIKHVCVYVREHQRLEDRLRVRSEHVSAVFVCKRAGEEALVSKPVCARELV